MNIEFRSYFEENSFKIGKIYIAFILKNFDIDWKNIYNLKKDWLDESIGY